MFLLMLNIVHAFLSSDTKHCKFQAASVSKEREEQHAPYGDWTSKVADVIVLHMMRAASYGW